MHRFFVSEEQIADGRAHISGDDLKHLKNVLRMRQGDEAVICDGMGTDYEASLCEISDREAYFLLTGKRKNDAELPVNIRIFQCLPKGDKMDLIIQKTVELGAVQIVPVASERCVVVLDQKKGQKKTQRWQQIARSAAQQSGRGVIPDVLPPVSFSEAVRMCAGDMMTLFLYEQAEGMAPLREAVTCISEAAAGDKQGSEKLWLSFFVGPEGGFEAGEVRQAKEAEMRIVSMGRRILRTETAGLAMMSILSFCLEK